MLLLLAKTVRLQSILDANPAVQCNLSDPIYGTLYPWAIASIVVYGCGIPLLFAFILVRFRKEIKGDQALRAVGLVSGGCV